MRNTPHLPYELYHTMEARTTKKTSRSKGFSQILFHFAHNHAIMNAGGIMIEKVNWDDSYLLGITDIDEQHKKLLEIANELYAIATGSPETYKLNMSVALKKLTDYTVYHFSNEEDYMKNHGYSGVDAHKVAHDNFVKEVNFQIQHLSSDDVEEGARFYSYVARWVMNHIAKADKIWAAAVKNA